MAAALRDGAVVMLTADELADFGERCAQLGAQRALAERQTSTGHERRVSRQGLAEAEGVSLATVDRWVRSGLPCESKSPRRFDVAKCRRWLAERSAREAAE